MNIAVIGAADPVGRLVVRRALGLGYAVRALVDSADALDPQVHLQLTVGDLGDPGAVVGVIEGSDAVITTSVVLRELAASAWESGVRTVVAGMQQHQVRRLVVLAGPTRRAGLDPAAGTAEDVMRVVTGTDLAWTVVCAPDINDQGSDGYLLTRSIPPPGVGVPGRAVAASLVALAEQPHDPGTVLGVEHLAA